MAQTTSVTDASRATQMEAWIESDRKLKRLKDRYDATQASLEAILAEIDQEKATMRKAEAVLNIGGSSNSERPKSKRIRVRGDKAPTPRNLAISTGWAVGVAKRAGLDRDAARKRALEKLNTLIKDEYPDLTEPPADALARVEEQINNVYGAA